MKETMLMGERIYLRPLKEEDAKGNYPDWFNDSEVCKYNRHGRFPNTKEKTLNYIKTVNTSQDTIVLAIVDKKIEKHIGNISLQRINLLDRNAELSIVIGEKDYWNKGYGKEACKLLISHGFKALDLHRIYSGTHEENAGFINLAISLGMKEEGRFTQDIFKNGKYSDTIWFSIVNPEDK